ncbi:MAG: glycosyltransferase family 2 protein [Xanthomarina gelatinilytica]|uniref:glycosyltransferase family 2 protein n=1 Tax=Xanthomarina gelatinilytica TaxID=1137281 RepID=UPI003A88701D
MSQPLISIIVPCYNVEAFVYKALESVYQQTYKNWECLVIDDGSKDSTLQQIELWTEKDIRFKSFSQENQGISITRNNGLKAAKGEYVYFFDSDDLLDETALEDLYSLIDKDVDIVVGKNVVTVGQNRNITEYLEHYHIPLKKITNNNKELIKLIVEQPIICVAWNKLFKMSFLKNHQLVFKKNLLHEDELWFFETFYNANAIVFNNKPTYYYNWSNMDSITNNFRLKNLEDYLHIIDYIFEKYYINNSNTIFKEFASIYLTHLQMKTIQHGYKQIDKKLKKQASEIIKLNFDKVEPRRTLMVLDLKLETLQYNFKIVKVLNPKAIAKALRYFESTKKMKLFKGNLLKQKAMVINKKKNRTINKVH